MYAPISTEDMCFDLYNIIPYFILQVNGVECLSDILNADKYNEMVRSEAAGVVAQITSPTLDHYQHINGFIENMEDLIRSLTSKSANLQLDSKGTPCSGNSQTSCLVQSYQ